MAKWHELYDYSSGDGSKVPKSYYLDDKIKKEFIAIQKKIFDDQTKIHDYKTKKKLTKKQAEDKENFEKELQSLQDINNNNNNLTKINKFLHSVGSIVYHSQDSEYFAKKKNIIKSIQKKPPIKKTIFREDVDGHVLALKNQPSCEVSSAKELILHRRLVDKSFKLELKNFKEADQKTQYTLTDQVHFSKFLPTRIENNTIGISTKPELGDKKQLYRKSYIADLASYDSDKDDYQKTLKYRWKDINFVKMNNFLKEVFKGNDISLKDPNVATATEIISLLFVTETSRNSTTFLTAPIFLELLAAGKINLAAMRFDDNFPMAMKEAVTASRHLDFLHFDEIKDIYDYMKGGAEQGKKLLLKENELFFKWLKLKEIDNTPKQWGEKIQKLILDWYDIAVKIRASGEKSDDSEQNSEDTVDPVQVQESELIKSPSTLSREHKKPVFFTKKFYKEDNLELINKMSSPSLGGMLDQRALDRLYNFRKSEISESELKLQRENYSINLRKSVKQKIFVENRKTNCAEYSEENHFVGEKLQFLQTTKIPYDDSLFYNYEKSLGGDISCSNADWHSNC